MELKYKHDGFDLNLVKIKKGDESCGKYVYNANGDYFRIGGYDIRFFRRDKSGVFLAFNTYPNEPREVLKYLAFHDY